MKKSLIALAALAATASFAQSSVVIDGYIDRAYTSTNNTDNTKDAKAIGSSAGTTTIGFKIREDLGGGMSVGASINTDWADLGGATQANAVANAQGSGFANSQSFIDLTGKFGVVRLGSPNNFTLTNAISVASPAFSTGVGSAYSSAFSIANGLGTGTVGFIGTVGKQADITNTANVGARAIRISNTIQYSSPSFNGLSVHLGYTPKNNNVTANSGAGNTVGVTEAAVRYTNGPLDAMFTTIKYDIGSNGVRQTSIAGATPPAVTTTALTVQDNTQNLLGASYAVMSNLKLHAGYGTFSSSGNNFKGSSQSVGVTYTMGAVDILAQVAQVNDKSTTNVDRKMMGLGANYNLSKTARLYARYDNINYGDNVAAAAGSKQNRYALGLSKSF